MRSEDYLLFSRPPRRIVIGGDNDRPELLRDACQDAQLLVHEATYTHAIAEAGKADFGHSTAAQVATFAQEVGIPNLILTHFSPRYQRDPDRGLSIEDIRTEAAKFYEGTLFLAEDFLRLSVGKDGEVKLGENPQKTRCRDRQPPMHSASDLHPSSDG